MLGGPTPIKFRREVQSLTQGCDPQRAICVLTGQGDLPQAGRAQGGAHLFPGPCSRKGLGVTDDRSTGPEYQELAEARRPCPVAPA